MTLQDVDLHLGGLHQVGEGVDAGAVESRKGDAGAAAKDDDDGAGVTKLLTEFLATMLPTRGWAAAAPAPPCWRRSPYRASGGSASPGSPRRKR